MTLLKSETYGTEAARDQWVPRGLANTHPIFVARAEGTRLWDLDGKEYLDFTSGIGVLNTGHRHPRVVDAVRRQLDRVTHTCFQVTMYEPYVELASRLARIVGNAPHKAILFTTGAEAIENAVKIARAHTKRSGVVAFQGGFHGRTLLSLTLTASSPVVQPHFRPGDALFFDGLLLHRSTQPPPALPGRRYAIETWFFRPSRFPAHQEVPLSV